MNLLEKCLLAGLCLQLTAVAHAAPPPASKAVKAKPVAAPAPLSEAERDAKRCQPRAPLREHNPQGTMLWGSRRGWDTEKVAEERSSVLVSVALEPVRPSDSGVKALQLQGGQLVASPAGKKVAGTVLQGTASDGKPVEVAICSAEPSPEDSELVWYRIEAWNPVAQDWENPCVAVGRTPNPRALAVRGVWDATGARQDVPGRFTFACENGAITKCIRWGYKPWASRGGKPLTELHQACTRMARADYCGDGRSHTHEDTTIDMYDQLGLLAPSTEVSADWDPARGSFEAAWGPDGATCLSHTRDGRAVEAVLQGCPSRFRTGATIDLGQGDRCSIQRVDANPKTTVLRNRSYGVKPGAVAPAAIKR
jgi:hypothetical protein